MALDIHEAEHVSGERGIRPFSGRAAPAHPQSAFDAHAQASFSHRNGLHAEGRLLDLIAVRIPRVLGLRIEIGQQLPGDRGAGFPGVSRRRG